MGQSKGFICVTRQLRNMLTSRHVTIVNRTMNMFKVSSCQIRTVSPKCTSTNISKSILCQKFLLFLGSSDGDWLELFT